MKKANYRVALPKITVLFMTFDGEKPVFMHASYLSNEGGTSGGGKLTAVLCMSAVTGCLPGQMFGLCHHNTCHCLDATPLPPPPHHSQHQSRDGQEKSLYNFRRFSFRCK